MEIVPETEIQKEEMQLVPEEIWDESEPSPEFAQSELEKRMRSRPFGPEIEELEKEFGNLEISPEQQLIFAEKAQRAYEENKAKFLERIRIDEENRLADPNNPQDLEYLCKKGIVMIQQNESKDIDPNAPRAFQQSELSISKFPDLMAAGIDRIFPIPEEYCFELVKNMRLAWDQKMAWSELINIPILRSDLFKLAFSGKNWTVINSFELIVGYMTIIKYLGARPETYTKKNILLAWLSHKIETKSWGTEEKNIIGMICNNQEKGYGFTDRDVAVLSLRSIEKYEIKPEDLRSFVFYCIHDYDIEIFWKCTKTEPIILYESIIDELGRGLKLAHQLIETKLESICQGSTYENGNFQQILNANFDATESMIREYEKAIGRILSSAMAGQIPIGPHMANLSTNCKVALDTEKDFNLETLHSIQTCRTKMNMMRMIISGHSCSDYSLSDEFQMYGSQKDCEIMLNFFAYKGSTEELKANMKIVTEFLMRSYTEENFEALKIYQEMTKKVDSEPESSEIKPIYKFGSTMLKDLIKKQNMWITQKHEGGWKLGQLGILFFEDPNMDQHSKSYFVKCLFQLETSWIGDSMNNRPVRIKTKRNKGKKKKCIFSSCGHETDDIDYECEESNISWDSRLSHYVKCHNIMPTHEFYEWVMIYSNQDKTQ